MIEFSHVYKTYMGPVHALKDVNLKIKKGDFVYITGPSGAGKTTLFKLLSAYDKPSSGKIIVSGYDIDKISSKDVPFYRRRIGVVFQDFKLLDEYTVIENVALPLKILGSKPQFIKKRVGEILHMVGLRHRQDFFPDQLSGGEKQRVAIARALIHQPDVLIADEPTGNLDPELSKDIMRIFEKANAQGTTLIIATHDVNLINENKKTHLKIENGELGFA